MEITREGYMHICESTSQIYLFFNGRYTYDFILILDYRKKFSRFLQYVVYNC